MRTWGNVSPNRAVAPYSKRREPEIDLSDLEFGAKVFCGLTLIGIPAGFTLGCIIYLLLCS